MAFGFKSINDNNETIIDSFTPVLTALQSGSYTGNTGTNNADSFINFNDTLRLAAEPPMLFIRPASIPNGHMDYMTGGPYGSANNWERWRLNAYDKDDECIGDYFAAQYIPPPDSGGFGMKLYGADGALLYNSNTSPVVITDAIPPSAFTYIGREEVNSTTYLSWSYIPFDFSLGKFVLINHLAFRIAPKDYGNGNFNLAATHLMRFDFQKNRLLFGYQARYGETGFQSQPPYDFVFAKPANF